MVVAPDDVANVVVVCWMGVSVNAKTIRWDIITHHGTLVRLEGLAPCILSQTTCMHRLCDQQRGTAGEGARGAFDDLGDGGSNSRHDIDDGG